MMTTAPPGLVTRRAAPSATAGIAGVLERIEARDHVEAVVVEGQILQITQAEIARRRAPPRDVEERLGGVDARHLRAARRRDLRRHAGAAAHIEMARAIGVR
jgi:hypothetical protein